MDNNKYYLRVEGVNLDNFVYDTANLSVIRGGGLLLLDAPGKVRKWLEDFPGIKDVKTISQGASWGLFSFSLKDWKKNKIPLDVAECVRKKLSGDEDLRHATFVVDVLKAGEKHEYQKDRDKLTAISRWRQMASPSIAFPSQEPDGEDGIKGVCELDFVRPAGKTRKIKEKDKDVSLSVYQRFEYGLENKKKEWYQKITGISDLPEFTKDLHQLAEDETQGILNRKMALVYIDGNNFGSMQRRLCATPEKQREFDKLLRVTYQGGALSRLMEQISTDPGWKTADDKIRFETLLWGGDEVIWVAPAWKGWWLVGEYFRMVSEEEWKFQEANLTFGAGLVFCHYNAPIHRIKSVAHELLESAKSISRTKNLVACQVLESFDHAGSDFSAFRESRRPPAVAPHELAIKGDHMLSALDDVRALKADLPKRVLHRIVQAIYSDQAKADKLIEQHGNAVGQNLKKCLGEDYGLWLHLLELWDYMIPEEEDNGHV